MTGDMVHPCGCMLAMDFGSGVHRSEAKCHRHRSLMRDPATLDAAYYEELKVLKNGVLQPTGHVAELAEALGQFPAAAAGLDAALEVGCGASPYVDAIRDRGYRYTGLDVSPWAAGWVRDTYGVEAHATPFERFDGAGYGLVLAAHVLEHVEDSPVALARLCGAVAPGGELWVIVPVGPDDWCNPDHLWFWTPEALAGGLASLGMEVAGIAIRQHVRHERWIYCRARKPG